MLAAQLNELGVSQGPEAPPRPNRQHKGPTASATSNSGQSASSNDQNNKQMPQSSSILDQVSIPVVHEVANKHYNAIMQDERRNVISSNYSSVSRPNEHSFL